MSRPKRKSVLIVIWAIVVSGTLLSLWSEAARGQLSPESLDFLLIVPFGAIGSSIFIRYPRHPVGWTFLGVLLFFAVDAFVESAAQMYVNRLGVASTQVATSLDLIEAYRGSISVSVWFSMLIFPALYFPNGELPSPRWRHVVRVAIAMLVVETLNPQVSASWFPEDPNVFSVPVLGQIADITEATLVIVAVIAPVSLLLRFRKARGVERQQIKWPLFSALLATIGISGLGVAYAVANVAGVGVAEELELLAQVGLTLEGASVLTFPFTIGIGILRYRLYDIDLLINRTLVYGTLTALLASVYFAGVVSAQQILPAESPIAVVLSTLAIVALFSPLRRRVQTVIDKRFYRQRYDARQALASFGEELRDDIDLDQMSEALLKVVNETVFPEHASLWLRRPGR